MFWCSRAVHAGKVGRSRLSRLTGPRFCSTVVSWGHVVQPDRSLYIQLWFTLPSPYHTTIFPLTFSPVPPNPPPQLSDAPADSVRKRTTSAPANQVDWITNGGRQIRVTADSGPSDLSLFFSQNMSNTNPPENCNPVILLCSSLARQMAMSHLISCFVIDPPNCAFRLHLPLVL